ncbi:MAG: (d)CMP kinase [Thiotrichales bacterium]|nr:(d)CMP kinase [Thiotrichales bacterium]
MTLPIITIDGPSGVGKGTLAQWVACKTGFHFLDSGAIYRALAYGVLAEELSVDSVAEITDLAQQLPVRFLATSVFYAEQDITAQIRTEAVAAIASQVAAIAQVREALLARQRAFAQLPGLVADGRDMGTVVFPEAPLKLYLTASAEIRAQRRVKQLKNQGIDANIPQIIQDIVARDERDATRKTAPLVAAQDAVMIDTTELSIEAVCQQTESLLWEKGFLS